MKTEIALMRRDTGATIAIESFSGDDWATALKAALYWLRIEIFPYWQYGQLDMSILSDDTQLAIAMQTIALVWGWCDGALPERL
jgi:hypothetical protein